MLRSSPSCGGWFTEAGYSEIVLPAIWESDTFLGKIGPEKEAQMWTFRDRGNRAVCLVPEATGMVQELWNNGWAATMPKPARLFYVARCYRYERPQAGRYREFTQFGIEALGPSVSREEVVSLMKACLDELAIPYTFNDKVRRGLRYYIDAGFETECAALGAVRQLGGGGRYAEGIGWAFGVERLLLAQTVRGGRGYLAAGEETD